MSHGIVDNSRPWLRSWGSAEGLVVTRWIERERADEFTVLVDDADVCVCDEERDALVSVFGAETDVVQATEIAQRDAA